MQLAHFPTCFLMIGLLCEYAACADAIPNGGSLNGVISVSGERDTHAFFGSGGQRGVISVSGDVGSGESFRGARSGWLRTLLAELPAHGYGKLQTPRSVGAWSWRTRRVTEKCDRVANNRR